jgi:hypothetical protein
MRQRIARPKGRSTPVFDGLWTGVDALVSRKSLPSGNDPRVGTGFPGKDMRKNRRG